MRRIASYVLILAVGTFLSVAAHAEGARGTKDEAKAMVERAAAFYKENGKEKAVAEFNNPKGQFIDRDLYVFALDMQGIRVAHGTNQKLVGKSILDFKDVDGKPYGQEIVDIGKGAGTGWVDYKFTDPLTKKVGEKTTYVSRVDDIIIASGAYKQ